MIQDDFIQNDLFGFPYNGKFPPCTYNFQKSKLYHGYDTPAQECLFYDFAVQGYDLKIKYKGIYYYFMVDSDCVWLSDKQFCATKERFKNGNDVLTNFLIDGKPLYSIVDDLEEYESM